MVDQDYKPSTLLCLSLFLFLIGSLITPQTEYIAIYFLLLLLGISLDHSHYIQEYPTWFE